MINFPAYIIHIYSNQSMRQTSLKASLVTCHLALVKLSAVTFSSFHQNPEEEN